MELKKAIYIFKRNKFWVYIFKERQLKIWSNIADG